MKTAEKLPACHIAVYSGKLVPINYVVDANREFSVACQRVVDNAGDGFVITPKGKVYSLTRNKRMASPVAGVAAEAILNRWRWSDNAPATNPPAALAMAPTTQRELF